MMLLLRDLLLWTVISLHVVGGAAFFNRLFPRESPWFGLVIPGLSLIVILNFIEHLVGLPTLLWLLPFTSLVAIYFILDPDTNWKPLILPVSVFLVSFAFTLTQRVLKPDILQVSSGTYDLTLISSFCMGQKVPPAYSWFPPYNLSQYYTFVHYSASVLTRLLNVDVGTGFNLSSAFLSAWMCVAFAAIAWCVSGGRLWITILAPILTECAANGSSAYMWLTTPQLDMNITSDLLMGFDFDVVKDNAIYHVLKPVVDYQNRRELEIPGFWSWLGSYHATNGGQFLTLFSVWSLVELLRNRGHRSNWPWVGLILTPFLMLITSTWGTPMVGVLLIMGLVVAVWQRCWPENLRLVAGVLIVTELLLVPTLEDFLASQIFYFRDFIDPNTRTQLFEFLIYWWPIYLPWIALFFAWKRLSAGVRIVMILTPIAFEVVEWITFGVRIDMTGKIWGYIWGMAWSVMFPALAMQRGWVYRSLLVLLLTSAAVSMVAWIDYTKRTINWDDMPSLAGTGSIHRNEHKASILKQLSLMRGKIIQPGSPAWNCPDSGTLANFSLNYAYIDGCFYIDNTFCPGTGEVGSQRHLAMTDFYEGKIADPLTFARQRGLDAIVIWPDDNTSDELLAKFKKGLSPLYEYIDFRQDGDPPNAGIFIYRSSAESLPGAPHIPPSDSK